MSTLIQSSKEILYFAFVEFRSFKTERILFIWNTLHVVSLCQHSVLKIIIWSEMKIKNEAHGFLIVAYFNVNQVLQDGLIMILNHVSKELYILEDCQPEFWYTFHVFLLSFTLKCNFVLHVLRKFLTFLVIIQSPNTFFISRF